MKSWISLAQSLPAVSLLVAYGCSGPFTAPAFRRLDVDQQTQVNQMWNNMLVKPDRLDRELLLDVLIAFELHEVGVDRGTYHSEKDFAGGLVLMDMRYDRQRPLEDWFFVELRDHDGKPIRKEHYSGDEIWSHYKYLVGFPMIAAAVTQPTTGPSSATQPTTQSVDDVTREQWLLARYRQIWAATQPTSQNP